MVIDAARGSSHALSSGQVGFKAGHAPGAEGLVGADGAEGGAGDALVVLEEVVRPTDGAGLLLELGVDGAVVAVSDQGVAGDADASGQGKPWRADRALSRGDTLDAGGSEAGNAFRGSKGWRNVEIEGAL